MNKSEAVNSTRDETRKLNIFKKIIGKGKRGWLKPIIVAVLRRSNKNGKEITDEIENLSLGLWRPSPGSLYPTLGELVEEGIIEKDRNGKYRLTELGKKVSYPWESERYAKDNFADIINEMDGYLSYLEDFKRENKKEFEKYKRRFKEISKRCERLLS